MKSEKNIFKIVVAVSIVVCIIIVLLNRKIFPRFEPVPHWVYALPALNAFINGTCSVLLLMSYYFIRRKKVLIHKRINLTAFFLSCLFIVSYITYHWLADETRFPVDNPLRYLYLVILSSHIVLAAIVLPLVLMSFYHGLNMNIPSHKKFVRWAFPVWLYVTTTGVIVYLMISPYYNH